MKSDNKKIELSHSSLGWATVCFAAIVLEILVFMLGGISWIACVSVFTAVIVTFVGAGVASLYGIMKTVIFAVIAWNTKGNIELFYFTLVMTMFTIYSLSCYFQVATRKGNASI